jgi:hypothetical protein
MTETQYALDFFLYFIDFGDILVNPITRFPYTVRAGINLLLCYFVILIRVKFGCNFLIGK